MDRRTERFSPLEAALAKLKQREASLWGRAQMRNHEWLAHLEGSPLLRRFTRVTKRSAGFPSLRAEPAIDLDSSVLASLLFHLLLLLLLMPVILRPALPTSPEPIKVRLLDLGPPAQASRKEAIQKTAKKNQPQKRPVSPLAPRERAEPKMAEPEPKAAPSLPAPKVLAQAPLSREMGFTGPPAESLIQLPTRSPKAEASSLATTIDPLPETLARTKGLRPEPGRQAESLAESSGERAGRLAALSSPDFGPYLEMIKRRVQSVWKYPEGISGTHQVNVLFVIDRGGKLARVEILDSSDPRIASSALQAMRQASPFPPIPASLKDLSGWPLRMRFTVDFGVKVTQ